MKQKYILRRSLPPFVGFFSQCSCSVCRRKLVSCRHKPIPGERASTALPTPWLSFRTPATIRSIIRTRGFRTPICPGFQYQHWNVHGLKLGNLLFRSLFLARNDSPPILGDFPTDSSQVRDYIFSPTQLGVHDVTIEVDGK